MSPLTAFIRELEAHGVRLLSEGGKLIVDAPKGAVSPDELARLRAAKAELLAWLRARAVVRWCEEHHVDPTIGAEIMRIEPEALALGWTPERLWNPHYWPHSVEHPRGLASILMPGDTIAEVAAGYITILAGRRCLQRFPKTDS